MQFSVLYGNFHVGLVSVDLSLLSCESEGDDMPAFVWPEQTGGDRKMII